MLALGFSTSPISIRCSCKIMKSLFALVWQSSLDGRLTKTWPAFRFGICYRTLSFIMATPSSSQKASTSASIPSTTPGQMKNKKSVVGAPSQRAQASRKGKKAWRKNIDLDEVETGLEEIRTEEIVTGYGYELFLLRTFVHTSLQDFCAQEDGQGTFPGRSYW